MTPEAELLLMNAARAQLVREVVRPALTAGEAVVCDRFLDSTVAYQGWGRGLPVEQVRQVLDLAVGDTFPDLTLLFEVRPEVSEERRRRRLLGEGAGPAGLTDRFEDEARAFHDRVAAGFRAIAAAEKGRVVVIDATPGVEEVAQSVWRVVEERMRALNRMG